ADLHILVLYPFSSDAPTPHRHLHSFPTRRSSDLSALPCPARHASPPHTDEGDGEEQMDDGEHPGQLACAADQSPQVQGSDHAERSEEHTSELQSRENLVCRLLLEKKNTNKSHANC